MLHEILDKKVIKLNENALFLKLIVNQLECITCFDGYNMLRLFDILPIRHLHVQK